MITCYDSNLTTDEIKIPHFVPVQRFEPFKKCSNKISWLYKFLGRRTVKSHQVEGGHNEN